MAKLNLEIVNEIMSNAYYYNDAENESQCYVEYEMRPGVVYFEPLESPFFKAHVAYCYRQITGQQVSVPIAPQLEILREDMMVEGACKIHVRRRLAGSISKNQIQYFLANDDRNVYWIDPEERGILEDSSASTSDVRFLKNKLDKEQVMPVENEHTLLTLLRPFVNLSDDDFRLFVIALVHFFSRDCSHFGMIFSSEKGSGKSTLSKVVRELVEPSDVGITLISNSESDLKNTLAGNYVVAFDNVGDISVGYSNILCGAITGSRDSKRKLYTNCEQEILHLHNAIVINGISIDILKSDLAQRCLLFNLRPISRKDRKPDTQFWNDFNQRKPYIMDAIFRTLQEAMRIYPTLQTSENLHRMADAQLEMEAIALALGLTREDCRKLISQNELEMQKAYAASNPFIETILDYFLSQGKPFIEMRMQAMIDDIREKRPAARSHVPAFPSPFSQKLNLDKSVLEMFGVRYIKKKDNAGAIVRLEKIPKKALTSEQKDMIRRREELREELEKYDSILSEYDIPEEEETPETPVKKSGFKKLIPEKQQKNNWYDEEDTESAADTDSASVDH